mmetsp:Transcript_28307/g.40543  ORF Transcript_28307/g.40543 Transcript_28307/m.40543 type:complete len:169 (+) Transcript_28307:2348-2854(+)
MMVDEDQTVLPEAPEFRCICGSANGASMCSMKLVKISVSSGAGDETGECVCMMNDKDVAVEVQQEQRCASQLMQAQEEPVRGRIARRRGRINRSRSLYNKSLTKEDSMTQPVITQWSHLFVRRRASSVDSPRVSPLGESSAASAPPLSTPPQELDLNTTASEEEQLAP